MSVSLVKLGFYRHKEAKLRRSAERKTHASRQLNAPEKDAVAASKE